MSYRERLTPFGGPALDRPLCSALIIQDMGRVLIIRDSTWSENGDIHEWLERVNDFG